MNAGTKAIVLLLCLSLCMSACGERENSAADGDADESKHSEAEIEIETEDEIADNEIENSEAEEESRESSETETEAEAEDLIENEEEADEEALYDGVLFRFPLNNSEGLYSEEYVFGVDHDPAVYQGVGAGICLNYEGDSFPTCYDEHRGSDFILHGGFDKMDEGTAFVYAAADGVVTETVDGNYDRCHIDYENLGAGQITCDGHPIRANYVKIEHRGGITSMYYHLANGSVGVKKGDEVSCGQQLGRIGSSGISSCPHLHFQVEDSTGKVIDPFMGELSQPWSYWVVQKSESGLPGEICESGNH